MRNECYYATTTKLWRDEPSKDEKKKLKLRSNRQPEVTVSVIQYSKWNHQYQDFETTAGKMKDSARYADLASDPSNNYHCATLTSEETLRGKEVF
jgi:hypothetical protein